MASFDLVEAEVADIPELSRIHVAACWPDNAVRLYFSSPEDFGNRITEMLEGQVGTPEWEHVKAVDKVTGATIAWASWYMPIDATIREEQTRGSAPPQTATGEFDFPPGLPMHVKKVTDQWLSDWTTGRRHIQCRTLDTDPPCARRGAGSALVAYGNRIADARAVPIVLQASPEGCPIYEKFGFRTVEFLDVDLREWAPKAEANDKGYGNYRFRYMLRLPQILPIS